MYTQTAKSAVSRYTCRYGCWLLLLLVTGISSLHAQPLAEQEYRVKAAFLYNFAKFVEWSDKRSATQNNNINVCIIGRDPFGDILISLRGKTVQGKEVVTTLIQQQEDIHRCHLLFVGDSERTHLRSILSTGHDANVLTISDMENFAAAGGIIQLTTIKQKVRFEINIQAARQAGIKISSRLLRLASRIYGNVQEEGR